MPKVLRIINRLNLGGPTYNACYLSKYMDAEFETLLVSGMHDETEASSAFIAEGMGLQPKYIADMHRSINPFRDRKAFAEVKQIIKDFKPDIVHTHAAKAGALGRLAAHQCNVPVIVHTFHGHVFHSYFNPIKTRVFLEIERYLARRSTRIIAISELQKAELTEKYKVCSPDKAVVIPLGFDLTRFQQDIEEKRQIFRKKYVIDDDEIAIGIVGRLVPIKNHPLFIDAITIAQEKTNKKIRAFIIGDGEDRAMLEQYVREKGIAYTTEVDIERKALITFTSWIKDVDVAYAGVDIVALTSFNEGTPVSLIEAQAANKPIVSTAVGGIKDVVRPNVTALLSETGNTVQFANHIITLVENDQLRHIMGKDASKYVIDKYHFMRLVRDMESLYKQLLADRAKA
ncbi:MAG: glycosyltransferase [Chitinophagales bacterium]|nr:glycosyltransferase [Chitinophagales bacterium]